MNIEEEENHEEEVSKSEKKEVETMNINGEKGKELMEERKKGSTDERE